MSTSERIRAMVEPIVDESDVELLDVEHNGSVLRITVDRPAGVGVDVLQRLSRAISRHLDEEDPIAGRYMLEVSSPGLERPLKRVEHYERALGDLVTVKTRPGVEGDRRAKGTLVAVDESGIEIDLGDTRRHLRLDQIASARTVFEWGPTPKSKAKKGQSGRRTGTKPKADDATASPEPNDPQGAPSDTPASSNEVSAS